VSRVVASFLAACAVFFALDSRSGVADGLVPTPIGVGPEYHPRALSVAVVARRPVGELRCATTGVRRFGVHLELFGRGRVVIVPAGIGVAPPWRMLRPHVLDGVCSYPARTRTSIGVIEVAVGSRLTLGQLFELWGQPLGRRRLAGFRAKQGERVRAFVDGSRWRGPVRSIPLQRHAAIALELGAYVPPHPSFLFGMGL
jgi:hypothetical protein